MDDVIPMNILNTDQLRALTHSNKEVSFQMQLEDEQVITIEKILRLVPKRRLVAIGSWKGESIVLKLFFHRKRASMHANKDANGSLTLQKIKIPTPPLLYKGISQDKQTQVLIFSRIFDAETLDLIWWNKARADEHIEKLKAVIVELATQHVFGVIQHDLHLKNFLATEKMIYTLDGADVELHADKLSKQMSMENIALFLSQLGTGVGDMQETLFRYYAKQRGWIVKSEDINMLFTMIKQWDDKRWGSFARKIYRDATDFQRIRTWNKKGMVYRDYTGAAFSEFIRHPDVIFSKSPDDLLKAGRSSTVIKATFDGKMIVIKRYNLKNIMHRLRRLWRTTRAEKNWRLMHKLNLFGIKTAKPIAYLEYNGLGFHGRSYYLSDYIEGQTLLSYLTNATVSEEDKMVVIEQVVLLFKKLKQLKITHGDLKETNILINQQKQPLLIDWDGAKEYVSTLLYEKGFKKEMKRFLRNFAEHPALLEMFQHRLEAL